MTVMMTIVTVIAVAVIAVCFVGIWVDRPTVIKDPATGHWTAARSLRCRAPRQHGHRRHCQEPCCKR